MRMEFCPKCNSMLMPVEVSGKVYLQCSCGYKKKTDHKKHTKDDKCHVHIVKRGGELQVFDNKKVYATCFFACRSVPLDKDRCEEISEQVVYEVNEWICNKPEVNSDEIFDFVAQTIKKHDEEAAFMYSTHRDIS